jgi:BirA family biotin operon repressor/biotin-[acetyl-CoA-carboxylase] ligase
MNLATLQDSLVGLPIGPIRYYECTSSTNTEAKSWVDQGAPDLALVVADEQTAGKGRHERKWLTIPGASLAFSLVLKDLEAICDNQRKEAAFPEMVTRITALGSLAVSQALRVKHNLIATIKWPNDVLLNGRKTAGILAETNWLGDHPTAVILGIGINVGPKSVPPENELNFPATCVQAASGTPINRLEFLRSILEQILEWRNRIAHPEFLKAWEEQLAFLGEWIDIIVEMGYEDKGIRQGKMLGLDESGGLRLCDRTGQEFILRMGEIRLRPHGH